MSASTEVLRQSRVSRGAALARLALRIGGRYVVRSPRLLFASVERRGELRHDLALRSADEVAEELGSMKGVLMKLGQMASYIYEDMPAVPQRPALHAHGGGGSPLGGGGPSLGHRGTTA